MKRKMMYTLALASVMLILTSGAFGAVAQLKVDGTVSTATVDKAGTAIIPIIVDDATGIAGAAFTLTYDTTALTVTVTSAFFDTFEKQFKAINASYAGETSTVVDSITYTQPLINNDVSGTGMRIAAARAQSAADNTLKTLFTLSVKLNTGKAAGEYPINIVATTLNNTAAGYAAAGEPINLIIGADPTKPTTDAAAFPVLVASADVATKVVGGKVTFTEAAADSDSDGLPDAWETTTFGDLTTATATSDNDKDGYTDLQEYQFIIAGTKDADGADFNAKTANKEGGTGYSIKIDIRHKGDATGEGTLNATDALYVLHFVAGNTTADQIKGNVDVNADCVVNATDALYVKHRVAGNITDTDWNNLFKTDCP